MESTSKHTRSVVSRYLESDTVSFPMTFTQHFLGGAVDFSTFKAVQTIPENLSGYGSC